jgi:hypothetical protein
MLANCGIFSSRAIRASSCSFSGASTNVASAPGFNQQLGTLDRSVDPEHGARIGARDDLKVLILAGIDRRLHLLDHLVDCDDVLAGEMAALLREHLVFDLDARSARAFHHLDGPHHVQSVAEAGIGIDQHRNLDRIRDGCDVIGDLGERRQTDVGNAEIHIGDAGAGDINGFEPEILDHAAQTSHWRRRASVVAVRRASNSFSLVVVRFIPLPCSTGAARWLAKSPSKTPNRNPLAEP